MNSVITIMAILFIAAIVLPGEVNAAPLVEIETKLVGNSGIDLNWEEKDRLARVYTQFANFDINDRYFIMEIVQSSTGKTVSSSPIYVYSTSDTIVNFGSFASYMVNDRDICSYDMDEDRENAVCYAVMTGQYEIRIQNRDGVILGSESFFINDSR